MSTDRVVSDDPGADPSTSTGPLQGSEGDENLPEDGVGESESDPYEGFCVDDVYSQYLRHTFITQELRQISQLDGRERNRAKAALANRTQFHVRRVLGGPTTPYFGGLPVVITPGVEAWVQYFKTRGREQFIKWMFRGESFKGLVLSGLRQEGLPADLLYLAMIESGFSNSASSRVRATGTWQFMKATAQHYGLTVNHWIDERRDPVKSTVAAARYLRFLYGKFGDWYLAMAAYNAGPGKISRATKASGVKDFWLLSKTSLISRETKQYVPKMLAALIIGADPEAHGFNVSSEAVEPQHEFTTVAIARPTHLSVIAKQLGISFSDLKQWNPELIRNITPPLLSSKQRIPYQLKLPKYLEERFELIRNKDHLIVASAMMLHKIRTGDTLNDIARRYSVGIEDILATNPELKPNRLVVGQIIAVGSP